MELNRIVLSILDENITGLTCGQIVGHILDYEDFEGPSDYISLKIIVAKMLYNETVKERILHKKGRSYLSEFDGK